MRRSIKFILILFVIGAACLVVRDLALANGCADIKGTCRQETCLGDEQLGGAYDACIDIPRAVCCIPAPCDPELDSSCADQSGAGTTETNPDQAEMDAIINGTQPTPEEGVYLDEVKAAAQIKALKQAAAKLNYADINKPSDLIARAINLLMAFIGSISLVLYIVGGFMWMSAGGNDERVKKARNIFVWTSLGLVAMGASYMIVRTILERVG